MAAKKIKALYSELENIKKRRLLEYMQHLLDELSDNAQMLTAHVFEEMITLRTKAGDNALEEIIMALEDIVPMTAQEYRNSLAILYRLIRKADSLLADDIIEAFKEDICVRFSVDNVLNVPAFDRREVIRKLSDIFRGLVRFKALYKDEQKASAKSKAEAPNLERNLFNQLEP